MSPCGWSRRAERDTRATVCDINPDMLAVGRERAAARGLGEALTFAEANAEALPFADRSFDAATVAFGIRNVPRIETALAEAYRVLKIGGRFVCLEFSAVAMPGLDALYDLYSFNVIPALGRAVVGDAESYRYLVESIRNFPKPQAFADMMRAAGFRARLAPADERRHCRFAFRLALVMVQKRLKSTAVARCACHRCCVLLPPQGARERLPRGRAR